jgi:hypothetical protein
MPAQTATQQKKVSKVMHEFKEGDLESGRSHKKVKSPKQAIAIALSEAGASKPPSKRPKNKRSAAAKKAMNTREHTKH